MVEPQKLAKIKWACRRGMLELDFVLQEFLKNTLNSLDESTLDKFQVFLLNDDPDLYAWLMGYQQPVKKEDIEMVQLIRKTTEKESYI